MHAFNRYEIKYLVDAPEAAALREEIERRVRLPYRDALLLCDGRTLVEHEPAQRPFLEEVLDLVLRLDLRAAAMTGYTRHAYVGRDADAGLRVTFDQRIRGRGGSCRAAAHRTASSRPKASNRATDSLRRATGVRPVAAA
ncbi:VTC domain-containing protein [Nonomuraea wenchangensis]|uniref:VTC domain-containing protein n=1 Tax=Nonomuraea wenchangensis TaxID=568860 RepID=UPI00384F77EB